jgi:putative membrane protein
VTGADAHDAHDAHDSAADAAWRRVHPLTPLLRSWQVVAVLLVVVGQDVGEDLLGGDAPGLPDGRGSLIGVAVLAAAAFLGGLGGVLSWRFTRYRVTADALELDHGVLSRRRRRAPLDRLQAVDIVQPLVGRILGLARLTLEVAGAGDSKIELAYLTETQARALRNHLLATAAGLRSDAAAPPQVGDAPERYALEVPFGRLVGSIVLSSSVLLPLALVIGLIVGGVVSGNPGPIAITLPFLFGTASVVWKRLTGGFGFRVASAADGVRLRHGMLEQRTQTVPPGRVQAVRLCQPMLWRIPGWWQVEVNVAGYGTSGSNDGSIGTNTLLPVGTRDDAVGVLAFVLPALGVADTPGAADAAVDAGLTGTRGAGGFTGVPRRARWADPIGWRRRGYLVTGTALLLRRGVLQRELDVVPHARTQSCAVWQGPLQRRLGLASFELHSTPGPVKPTIEHLASDVAAELLDAQTSRSRGARRTASDAWLTVTE